MRILDLDLLPARRSETKELQRTVDLLEQRVDAASTVADDARRRANAVEAKLNELFALLRKHARPQNTNPNSPIVEQKDGPQ